MKFSLFATTTLAFSSSLSVQAFVAPTTTRQQQQPFNDVLLKASTVSVDDDPEELVSAIAEVREAASAFSEETEQFANVWIEKMLAGNQQDGMASGLLEECLIDDDGEACLRFEEALKKLDHVLGIGMEESF